MPRSSDQLAVALEAPVPRSTRREPRQDTVRIVEYTRFPRVGPEGAPRIGFTRDLSASGMCIGVDEPEPVGSLLRVTLRDVDGRPTRACVERVVWCSPARDGRHWIGVERLAEAEAA